MKKIGILHGKENTFPPALIEKINSMKPEGIVAELVNINKVIQAEPTEYAVILDRISHDVPFYRSYLKNAALCGTAVANNPFWWSCDEKFFNNCLMHKIGGDFSMPRTVLLPSYERPDNTEPSSFRNLASPLKWEEIFDYVGFPAFVKPYAGGGWKDVFKVNTREDLWHALAQTGQNVMMMQAAVDFETYYRCYCIGGNRIHIMQYEPRNDFFNRYIKNGDAIEPTMYQRLHDCVFKINEYLGYDFNTVEIAVTADGTLYPIDFWNPAPDADSFSVGEVNFAWVLQNAAEMLIERANNQEEGKINLTWGKFMQQAVAKDIIA